MKPALVIIGLGNPGASYARTRHNAGFQAIDALSHAFGTGAWKPMQKFQAQVQEGRILTMPVLFVLPETYMNCSGDAARKILHFYALDPSFQLVVLCDDVDIALGTIRFRKEGSAGSHNGLKSLCEQFGDRFARMRIGIGPKPEGADLATWVLSVPAPEEQKALQGALDRIPDMVRTYVLESPSSMPTTGDLP
jgi:PTH1 family peptidyl-tRNA hydrolase